MAVDSDSSDDENAARLREAVDTNFFKDSMFKAKGKVEKGFVKEKKKSQRFLENEDDNRDVRVSTDMQKRIGKKISEIIDSKIKFVDVPENEAAEQIIQGGVKLFSDSVSFATDELPKEVLLTREHRKKIKKRKLKEEVEEGNKFEVAVSGEAILKGDDTKHWKSRRRAKIFDYKVVGKHSSKLVLEGKE